MQLPEWATNSTGTFWRRNYELATLTEQACELVIEHQLENWLREVELMDGPAPAAVHYWPDQVPPITN